MRFPLLAYLAIGAGVTVTGAGVVAATGRPLTALALLGVAALAAELLEEPENARLREPVGPGVFRVASGVDIAAVIVLGPWRGALVAGAAAFVARLVRVPWRLAAFQASAFALATLAAGYAFVLGGGHPGRLALPDDLVPLIALAIAYLMVSRGILQLVGGGETLEPDFAAAAAETGFGAVLALFAVHHPWNALAVIPVAWAANLAHARVRRSRFEMLHALETFANIVGERDPSTYRHSVRVAGYVDELARALGFPYCDIDRLRWAARLHDLGKVAVDASALRKPGKLTPDQWGAMWRAPRLSARLLRRFELSAAEARAVELHHERHDGRGYYGVPGAELPLASHFLTVADSYDAMLSDRPYRPGLPPEAALAEIERNADTQFHPAVAKAFVAVQCGQDPYSALSPDEQDELRGAAAQYRVPVIRGTRDLKDHPELAAFGGLIAALAGIGLGQAWLVAAGLAIAAVGALLRATIRFRAERLRSAISAALAAGSRADVFDRLASVLEHSAHCRWAGLVAWEEGAVDGVLERSRGDGPAVHALMSWLVREGESGEELPAAPARELAWPQDGVFVALPLRRENSALVGFVVLGLPRVPPRHARSALVASLDPIGLALAESPVAVAEAPERQLAAL
ncbi:MAG TPA: HD domain-containing phosphohydrolase [Gaiellaceae bacterium]|nr:HD domain-containing phosphohydrolase [Gaiellaceae bacterium]